MEYMVTNRADYKGFVTVGPVDGTATNLFSGPTQFSDTASFGGPAVYLSGVIPIYELYQNFDGQTISGADTYRVLQFHGDKVARNNGMTCWNTSSFTFFPRTLDQTYTFRVSFQLSASSGNPVFHLCFDMVGLLVTGAGGGHVGPMSVYRQERDDNVVKGSVGHSHFNAMFMVVADADLMVSGAQFYAETDGQAITISSGTLLIKEG